MIAIDDLRLALKDPPTADNDYITELEAAAVAFLERETGRFYGVTDGSAEFVLEGNGTATLYMPQYVSAVTAVASRAYLGGDETTIDTGDSDGWELRTLPGETYGNRLVRKGGSGWSLGTEYLITASIGYAAGSEPADIRKAVYDLVTLWYVQRMPVAVGTIAGNVPLHVQRIIDANRRIPV